MICEYDYIISEQEKNLRLDRYLADKKECDLTRSQIVKLIETGNVLVNGSTPKPSYKIKINDRIIVTFPPPRPLAAQPENIRLAIVYEDNDIIVINKPRGMVVHPAAGNYRGTLVNALLNHCQNLSGIGGTLRPGIVHRLDKDTSGLIVVAKNDLAHQALIKQFKNRQIFKQYLALVEGVIKKDEGEIAESIGRHPVKRQKMTVGPGREAITHFKVLKRYSNKTLVELTPKTGRTHQIRVHLKHLGYPIVGDPVYGAAKGEGQLLHAVKLSFKHPRTGKTMVFEAALPEDFLKKLPVK